VDFSKIGLYAFSFWQVDANHCRGRPRVDFLRGKWNSSDFKRDMHLPCRFDVKSQVAKRGHIKVIKMIKFTLCYVKQNSMKGWQWLSINGHLVELLECKAERQKNNGSKNWSPEREFEIRIPHLRSGKS
jgi:hypothetical protein